MSEKRVLCQCGSVPHLASTNENNDDTTLWRLVCQQCGPKGAPWRHSQAFAYREWEKDYHTLKPELSPAGAD